MSSRPVVFVAVAALLASACTTWTSTNSVEVLNLTDETLVVRTASGDQEPRRLLPRKAVIFHVQRGGCMEDRLVAVDSEGNVVGENDQPCGGDKWVLEAP